MSTAKVKTYDEITTPKDAGVHHRLLCLTGEFKGKSYFLTGDRLVLGRGENSDIQVLDSKSSREHAELKYIDGSYVLTDLASQNGVMVNDVKVTQHKLKDNDNVIIGKTVYKYNIYNIERRALAAVPNRELTNKKNKVQKTEEIKNDKKRKIYIAIFVLLVVFLLFDNGSKTTGPKNQSVGKIRTEVDNSFSDALRRKQVEEDQKTKEKLAAIIHRGLREFREGNYFRAIEEFNLALILSPNNGRASFYLNRTKQRLDEEIESNFSKASREMDSLKYEAAIVSYCSVVRLLQDYPDDKRYKDAMDKIKELESKLGYLEGEIKCSQR